MFILRLRKNCRHEFRGGRRKRQFQENPKCQ
jgi:hypothetical protein